MVPTQKFNLFCYVAAAPLEVLMLTPTAGCGVIGLAAAGSAAKGLSRRINFLEKIKKARFFWFRADFPSRE